MISNTKKKAHVSAVGLKKKHHRDACSFCATELERRETWRRHRDKDLGRILSKVRDAADVYMDTGQGIRNQIYNLLDMDS